MGKDDWSRRPLDDELGEALRAELLGWPGVRVRAMMGTLAFLKGKKFLGCYVNRNLSKRKPEWLNRADEPTFACVRLRPDDAARAMRVPGLRKSRLEFVGWVEIPLTSRKFLEQAVRWFGRAYERGPRPTKRRTRKKK